MTDQSNDPSDQFVDQAESQRGAIEHLVKGLPGISGYVEKETRRDADKRLRLYIVGQLDADKQRLLDVQQRLLRSGGLRSMDEVDSAVTKLQTLSDRIRTASYGYAGFFDPVRVREEQLRSLYQFDVALAERTGEVSAAISALSAAVRSGDPIDEPTFGLIDAVNDLTALYDRRNDAILSPATLLNAANAPVVEPRLLELTDDLNDLPADEADLDA
jgi:hypothetical protein